MIIMKKAIILGRFQPFHLGHAHLITSASKISENIVVAIGSSEAEESMRNPWSSEEREDMIQKWSKSSGIPVEITCIPDINDPPNWVSHATKYHGEGILVTSDEETADLYRSAGWDTQNIDMLERTSLEGWRIRATLKMLSTVNEEGALESVMKETLPAEVISWFLEDHYRIYKLSTIGPDVEPVV